MVGYLWPDTIVEIYDRYNNWYQIRDGFVSHFSLQPMKTPTFIRTNGQPRIPFWAEVAAPAVSVRQWCAADAPLVSRIGHGGIAKVVDHLPSERHGVAWYRLDLGEGAPLGWTQADFWRTTSAEHWPVEDPFLQIDLRSQVMTVFSGCEPVLQAFVSLGTALATGTYPITGRQISGNPVNVAGQDRALYGVPWRVGFGGGHEIVGAYWHNRFGEAMPGPAVQVTPLLASWLYSRLGDNGIINVV
jgi:hypothetical protein